MKYCEISKEMSLLPFGLAVFCLSEARVPEFDRQPLLPLAAEFAVQFSLYTRHCINFWDSTLASNWQNTSSPKYNDGISLLIPEYHISNPHTYT
jgi:hypothetical protein